MKQLLPLLFLYTCFSLNAQEDILQTESWDGRDLCEDGTWEMVFNDEFNGNELDTSKWYTFYPYDDIYGIGRNCRVRDREDQIYLDENVKVEDGILKLFTKQEKVSHQNESRNHSSGMIHSKQIFRDYGKFEIRCKIPKGMGFWPAFWLFGWSTEIDIFEFGGHKPRVWHSNIIKWGKQHWEGSSKKKIRGTNYTKDFHVYACEYDPNFVRFFLDGEEKFVVSRYVNKRGKNLKNCELEAGEYPLSRAFPRIGDPLNIIVNTAVAFDKGSFTNAPNKRTEFPGIFEIDYIRVYQRK